MSQIHLLEGVVAVANSAISVLGSRYDIFSMFLPSALCQFAYRYVSWVVATLGSLALLKISCSKLPERFIVASSASAHLW
jgi:hypothetical protein